MNWSAPPDDEQQTDTPPPRIKLKLTTMVAPTRSSARVSSSTHHPSGSEYSVGNSAASSQSPKALNGRRRNTTRIMDDDDEDEDFGMAESQAFHSYTSLRGRTVKLKHPQYKEDETDEDEDDAPVRPPGSRPRLTRGANKRITRSASTLPEDDFIINDENHNDEGSEGYRTRLRTRKSVDSQGAPVNTNGNDKLPGGVSQSDSRSLRAERRNARTTKEEEDYIDGVHGDASPTDEDDAEGSIIVDEDPDDPVPSTPEEHRIPRTRRQTTPETRGYGLRKRNQKIDYRLPPPLAAEEVAAGALGDPRLLNPKTKSNKSIRNVVPWGFSRPPGLGTGGFGRLPPRMDDSDSDVPTQTPRKPFGAAAGNAAGGLFAAGASGTGFLPSDLAAAAGTPSNLGKIGTDSALADADPLGVNQNVTFDEVGGLDDHISSLKEMVTLPLLYPEVFQRFNLVPPRGVLFHGPPGTGKTLLARALAASSRSGGKGISFFMRKGADCLSKWVGEAERQLRLLFDEAKACQPSIIFFDEIDGLAPVRSSKQDQIHASIVSTLLALMDGMDGRGQVIVIGATNRPDAIDPALRRPGRFDREFYFPLPSLQARQKILGILTRGWEGFETEGDELRHTLAKATKGYGGADLRALCTEAALNAVQRRYPQIYKSKERLLLKPETINVSARDFMISVKNMIPSSQRSTATAAAPLPTQLAPLLEDSLSKVTTALDRALPKVNKRKVLDEAEYEEGDDAGSLDKELLLQSMDTLRVHRPRIVLHGAAGMGQGYIGSAALHHLEGFHVQSMDLGTLMGDSTRTVEAAIVQLFVEAKRHKPSIVYIPSMVGWCAAISEAARTTFRAMLDSLAPTDPLLLLGIVDGEFNQLPKDVRNWFGHNRENRIAVRTHSQEMRHKFFEDLLGHVRRRPTEFPDGVPRKKRILEELPIAPPLPPKMPTPAEIAAQEENDARLKAMLTHRLGPVLSDLKKKFKRFTKAVRAEYDLEEDHGEPWIFVDSAQEFQQDEPFEPAPVANDVHSEANQHGVAAPDASGLPNVDGDASMQVVGNSPPPPPAPPIRPPRMRKFFDVDLEKMHAKLYYEGYLTPQDFMEDVSRIVANAEVEPIDNERLFKAQAMYTSSNLTILSWEPQFVMECERMAQREHERMKERRKKEKGKAKVNGHVTSGGLQPNTNGDVYAPGTRRSARNNGQEPEIAITDPLQLERRLKRQRSDGAADSQGSDQGSGSRPRSPKRARGSEDDGIVSETNVPIDPSLTGAVIDTALVGGDMQFPPMFDQGYYGPPLMNTVEPYPPVQGHDHGRSVRFAPELGFGGQMDPLLPNGIEHYPNHMPYGHEQYTPQQEQPPPPNPMSLEYQLNMAPVGPPYPPVAADPQFGAASSLHQLYPANDLEVAPPQLQDQPLQLPQEAYAPTGVYRALSPMDPFAQQIEPPMVPIVSESSEPPSTEPIKDVNDMAIDVPKARTPSPTPPPLPDFNLDDSLMQRLEGELVGKTGSMNIEQLEQLRATLLSCVWNHRSEWDRNGLVDEMLTTLGEFVEEVGHDDSEFGSP